ncbi:MAG TPA: hypothetical protein VGM88_34215 [Kofleriaceae bacterium]
MEKAFQRQVIYGGALDTILLEMGLVPEERLTQYLALATGLPPAARDEIDALDREATALVPREWAEQYRAVPVAFEGEAVRVLVCSPVEISELEDFADRVDRPLQPLIAPEFRWFLALAAAYELDPPARFTTLARMLDATPVAPVGREKTIIVDQAAPQPIPAGDVTERTLLPPATTPGLSSVERRPASGIVSAAATDTQTLKFLSADPPVTSIEEPRSQRRNTLIGLPSTRASTETPRSTPRVKSDGVPAEPVPRPSITFVASGPAVARTATPRSPRTHSSGPQSSLGMEPIARPADAGPDSPLPVVRARELLATAEDRDAIFSTLLRAARSRARWAGLLTVQGGAAIGRLAIAEPGLDTSGIASVLIPLDGVSPFRAAVNARQPHIGPLASGDASIDKMVARMGGALPPSALILPIVLRDRVVALVVAHRVHNDLRLADVTELLPIAIAASEALGRLIVKHKAAGYRAPSGELEAVVEHLHEQIETKPLSAARARAVPSDTEPPGRDTGRWFAPARADIPAIEAGLVSERTELSLEAEAPRSIDAVLDEIEAAQEGHAEDALTEAVERAGEALGALQRRFPGSLRFDRFGLAGRPLRAAQYGGLLELVIRLGSVTSELLIEKMTDGARDVRFYATLCATELRPSSAVYGLAERLFDQDFGVRAAALEALAGYPVADLAHALVRVRRAVHSSDPEVVAAAATALVQLGDTEAVPDFIGAIERNDRAADHARRALVSLTAQDFGTSDRKWRKWYESARKRHRIEWLVDGLTHKDAAVRESAISDLRRLTGEYFGYHHDLPRKERDAAAVKWVAWWRDVGQHRFAGPDDEKYRPTGILPSRYKP